MKIKSGIKLLAESEGIGPMVKQGDQVTVRLNGWLNRGDRIQTDAIATILVGRRAVIPGIDYSLLGMRKGGVRKVKISAHLAYKDTGLPNLIPPNAALVYEIEMLAIQIS